MRLVFVHLLILTSWLLSPPAAVHGEGGPPEARVGYAELVLWVEAAAETLRLPHRFVDAESLSLQWQGRDRDLDYRVDEAEGLLILSRPAPESQSVRVAYRYLPLELPADWSHRILTPTVPGEAPRVEEGRRKPPSSSRDTQLQISGSKTFSVELGTNQDLSVDQTLDLSITGRVASDINVQAILTDRETPLQPEGTTRELEDLDQVFLRVEAPGAQLDLGDLEVQESRLRLASFQRQLEGASGRVRVGSLEGWGVGALTRGQYRQMQFFGQEGKQGPYRLLGPEEDEGIVVAGSEVVWLDGARMQRGEAEDYIIDYSTGELTFTSRRVITEQSEVVIDYEASLEAYRRSLFGLALRTPEPESGALLSVLYLHEGDNRGQPLGLVISDSERSLLEDVGDGTSPELDSGISFVGPGLGDYEKVEVDSLPEPIFLYAGPDSGSYRVSFIDVGAALGSYADSTQGGVRIFFFVGEGKGSFKPGRPVPRPKSLEVGDVALSWEKGPLQLQAEGAFSRYDENTFSSRDDGNNVDGAFDVSTRFRTPSLSLSGRPLGHFEARIRARQVGSHYESPGRIREGFFEQEWNASEGTLTGRERERGVGLDFVSERFRAGGDWERLSAWNGFGATRLGTEFSFMGPVRLTGQLRRVDSEDEKGRPGERQTERLGLEARRGPFLVDVDYTRERSHVGDGPERGGLQFRDIDVTARRGRMDRGLSLRARVNFRRRWRIQGDRDKRETDGLTTELETGWSRSAAFRANLLFVRRDLKSFGTSPGRTTHLGRLQVSQSAWGGALNSQWRAEATSQTSQVRTRDITSVGEGMGHYDAFGRYVGVGGYEVFFRETGEEQLQSVFDMTGRWTVAPGRRTKGSEGSDLGRRLWRESEWTAYLRARSESPEDLGRILRDPSRWWGRNGKATTGQGEARTDLRLFSRSQTFSPTLRWEIRSRVARTGETSEERRDTRSFQIQAVGSPRERLRLEGRQSWSTETLTNRVFIDEVIEDRQRLERTRTEATAVYRLTRPLRLRLQSARSGERFADRNEERSLWEVTPGLVLNLAGGRGELRVRRTWETGEYTRSRIFDLDRPGWTTRATADIKVQSAVDLSLWLEDRRPDEGEKTFTSRVSLRAFF